MHYFKEAEFFLMSSEIKPKITKLSIGKYWEHYSSIIINEFLLAI
jgi:hypothetical protein